MIHDLQKASHRAGFLDLLFHALDEALHLDLLRAVGPIDACYVGAEIELGFGRVAEPKGHGQGLIRRNPQRGLRGDCRVRDEFQRTRQRGSQFRLEGFEGFHRVRAVAGSGGADQGKGLPECVVARGLKIVRTELGHGVFTGD